jgi:hypothetical protein
LHRRSYRSVHIRKESGGMLNKVDSYGGSYCRAPLYLFHVFQIEFHIKQIDSKKRRTLILGAPFFV